MKIMASILLQKFSSLIGRLWRKLANTKTNPDPNPNPAEVLNPNNVRSPNPNLLYIGRPMLRVTCGRNRADSGWVYSRKPFAAE